MESSVALWPDSVSGWLSFLGLIISTALLLRKSGALHATLTEQMNGLGGRVTRTEGALDRQEGRLASAETQLERIETKFGLILERLIEARQESDRREERFREGITKVTAEIFALRTDVSEDFEEVKERLVRVEETVKRSTA